jgi:lipopolysaccharide transport system permease protein
MLTGIWQYRGFVAATVKREFKARYVGSMLGGLWAVLNPLIQIAVYTIVFAEIMRARLPGQSETFSYSIYLCAGLLPWTWFTEIVGRSTSMFLDNANIIKKSSFPRSCLPVAVFLSTALHFIIIFSLFLLVALLTGHLTWAVMLWAPPLILLMAMMGVVIGLFLGVLNVFLRDTGQIQPIILQLWFWLTPIVWPLTVIPEQFRPWFLLNPMIPIMEGLHHIFLEPGPPDLHGLLASALFALFTLFLGVMMFRRKTKELADEL